MPRVTLNQTNFTAGEVSPKCYGRVDVARYQNGAKSLLNCLIGIHGGARRRPGSVYIAGTKDHTKRSRLIPFVFSTTQAYMLEFGNLYMRVYLQSGGQVLSGGVPYEIPTPYTEAMLFELDYTQGADTMFVFHQGVTIHTIKRLASDNWALQQAPITVFPFDEIGHRFNTAVVLSNASVGVGRTMTAAAAIFLAGDVGRRITYLSGTARITAFTSALIVTVEVLASFPVTVIPADEWVLEDSPKTALRPSTKDPVGATVNLSAVTDEATPTLGTEQTITGLSHDSVSTVTATVPGHGFSNGNAVLFAGCAPVQYNGTYTITLLDADTVSYAIADPGPALTLGTARTTSSSASAVDCWRPADVGKFVRINGGLVKITAYSSAAQVIGVIEQELTSAVASPPDAWSLEASVWNSRDGYPRTGALYEQRLVTAGSIKYPQTIWGSRSGLFLDFTLGTVDDDAFSFTLPSTGQINPIRRMAATKCLIPLTYGGEHTMQGGVEKPLVPTNVQAKNPSTYGCRDVKPVRVGNELLFVQRAGRKIRAFSYRLTDDEFKSPDLTVLAEHITISGIVDMCYQQEPDSIVWCVRADGKIAALTLDREEGVTAWTPLETDGAVESIASIPNADGDEVWAIVRRTINGLTRRYVERFEEGLYTDCGIIGASAPGASVWAGLGHLEGKEVAVRADGVDKGLHTVQGGQITIDRDAFTVEIGLPFTNKITLLRPEVQAGDATAQGNAQRVHEVSLLFMETIGAKINGEEISFRQFGSDLLDQAPAEYSGIKGAGLTDWTRGDQEITISQDGPNPFHLLSVIRKFTVNS